MRPHRWWGAKNGRRLKEQIVHTFLENTTSLSVWVLFLSFVCESTRTKTQHTHQKKKKKKKWLYPKKSLFFFFFFFGPAYIPFCFVALVFFFIYPLRKCWAIRPRWHQSRKMALLFVLRCSPPPCKEQIIWAVSEGNLGAEVTLLLLECKRKKTYNIVITISLFTPQHLLCWKIISLQHVFQKGKERRNRRSISHGKEIRGS
jgi:4-amino-4-deoxy-L-arabinose transferase-like glycosyltransferase